MMRDAAEVSRPVLSARPALSGAPHILIADGDADTRSLYRGAFAHLGTIEEAADGADALVKARLQPPTLVVTEIRLPHVDGYTLCTTLRAELTTCNAKILVVTASMFEAASGRATHGGADAVLLKPCPIDVLCARVGGLLAERDGCREAAPPPTRVVINAAEPLDVQVDICPADGECACPAGPRLAPVSRRLRPWPS